MCPLTILQWWHRGEWREIGWRASDPQSAADLRVHAEGLAADNESDDYRLVHPSVYVDGPPTVLWERRRRAA